MFLPFKKRMIAAVVLIAGLNSGVTLAQDNKFLTLKEAVELCIENNKHLQLSNVRVEAAVAATAEAKDRRLPDVSASGSYIRLTKPTISGPLGNNETPNINN